MKSFAPVLTSAVLGLSLSACGQPEAPKTATAPAKVETPTATPAAPKPKTDRGALLYKKCQTCHTLGEGERHKVGPNLHGVMGAQAGQKEGFAYSKTMAASDVAWTDENLDAYINNPREFMPGNRMTFVGIRKAEDRALLIEYLKRETSAQ